MMTNKKFNQAEMIDEFNNNSNEIMNSIAKKNRSDEGISACIWSDMTILIVNAFDRLGIGNTDEVAPHKHYNALVTDNKSCNSSIPKIEVTFHNNKEIELVEHLWKMRRQEHFRYDVNHVDICFEVLVWLVSNGKPLMKVDITWKNMDYEKLCKLCQSLCSNTCVTSFTLSEVIQSNNTNDSIELGAAFKRLLQTNTSLQSITLYDCFLPKEFSTQIAEGISNNSTLTELTMSKCIIDDYGMKALSTALIHGNGSIEYLSLCATFISGIAANELAKVVCSPNCSLKMITLHQCNLCPVGIYAIVEALMSNTSLTIVDLNGNNLTLQTMQVMATVIRTNKVLQSLDLRHCLIDDEGVTCLVTALRWNATLVSLQLSNNNITDKGMETIANVVSFHPTLEILDLEFNMSTDEGVYHLLDSLENNVVLKELYLPACNDYDIVKQKLGRLLKYNDTIQVLKDRENYTDFPLMVPRTAPRKGSKRRFQTLSYIEPILCHLSMEEPFLQKQQQDCKKRKVDEAT
jgi:Ran GTPase-activating protein (RanGAP) involved in mRNA processing and transport